MHSLVKWKQLKMHGTAIMVVNISNCCSSQKSVNVAAQYSIVNHLRKFSPSRSVKTVHRVKQRSNTRAVTNTSSNIWQVTITWQLSEDNHPLLSTAYLQTYWTQTTILLIWLNDICRKNFILFIVVRNTSHGVQEWQLFRVWGTSYRSSDTPERKFHTGKFYGYILLIEN